MTSKHGAHVDPVGGRAEEHASNGSRSVVGDLSEGGLPVLGKVVVHQSDCGNLGSDITASERKVW